LGLLAPRSASASRAPAIRRRKGSENGLESCGEGGKERARDQEMAWNRALLGRRVLRKCLGIEICGTHRQTDGQTIKFGKWTLSKLEGIFVRPVPPPVWMPNCFTNMLPHEQRKTLLAISTATSTPRSQPPLLQGHDGSSPPPPLCVLNIYSIKPKLASVLGMILTPIST